MSQTAMRFTPRYPVVSYGGWQGAGSGYGAPIMAATALYTPVDAVAAPSPGFSVPDTYNPEAHWSNQDVQVAFDPYAQLRDQRRAYRERLERVEAQLAARDQHAGGGRMRIPWWGYVVAIGLGYFLWKRVKV